MPLVGGEEGRDQVSGLLPLARLARELLPAGGGERVVLRAAVVLRLPPLGLDEPFLLELEQGRVERAVVERESVLARLLDAPRDAVAVERAEDVEGLEDHEGEGALLDFELFRHRPSYGIPIPLCAPRSRRARGVLWVAHTERLAPRFQISMLSSRQARAQLSAGLSHLCLTRVGLPRFHDDHAVLRIGTVQLHRALTFEHVHRQDLRPVQRLQHGQLRTLVIEH